MITDQQKLSIVTTALFSFRMQYGIDFNPADFDIIIDKPNISSLCSMYIVSKRTDDNFKIKLYVKGISNYTSVTNYRLIQEENYSTGLDDEVQLAEITLDKTEFRSFYSYLLSAQFVADVIQSTNFIISEDGLGKILLESSDKLIQ
jgi:hypothetical protein